MWLFYAFCAAGLYAIAEIFDNFLANKPFKHPFVLVFYTSVFNLIFLPVLFYYQHPVVPPLHTIPIFLLLGLIEIGYLYPYYRGLEADDTSVAISFFAISRILIPVIAFFIVGEVLDKQQYAGILIIVVSVVALSIHHSRKKLKMSKAVWYISLSAFLLSFEGVLLKLLYDEGVNVGTAITGELVLGLLFAFALLFFVKARVRIVAAWPIFVRLSPIFLLEEFFTFIGQISENLAISQNSVSIVKGLTMSQPFFLIAYAWLGANLFPSFFKEDLHRKKVFRKLAFFALLIFGVMLIKG